MKSWTIEEIDNGLAEVNKVRPVALGYFNRLIRNYHGWVEDDRYFDDLAGDWIEFFCHSVVIAISEIDNCSPSIEPLPIQVFGDLTDYNKSRTSSVCFFSNFLSVAHSIACKNYPISFKFDRTYVDIKEGRKDNLLEKIVRLIGAKKPKVLIISPYFKCSRLGLLKVILLWKKWACFNNLNYQYTRRVAIDSEERLKLSKEAWAAEKGNKYSALVKAMLPLYLPAILFEDLDNFRNFCRDLEIHRPSLVYSANALYGNLVFKQLLPEWKIKGTRLIYHQHGGGYGLDESNVFEGYERRVSNTYLTWGWLENSTNLIGFGQIPILPHIGKSNKVVSLICVDFPKLPFRLHYHPMPGSIERMHDMTISFFEGLSSKENAWIKPYPIDYGWAQVKHLKSMVSIRNIKSKSTFEIYGRSKLVIHNYLGTSYLETLSLNIPTICIIDDQTYKFRNNASIFYKELFKNNIFQASGVQAYKFVNDLQENGRLESWWNSRDVQELRARFVERYANPSKNWRKNLETLFINQIEDVKNSSYD